MTMLHRIAAAGGSGGGGRPPLPPPVRRAPLGPFPRNTPQPYRSTLAFAPPSGPDLYFHRANFCGLTIPGAPDVPGCNHDHPEVIMPCLLDNYPTSFQDQYLKQYAQTYTHLQRSIGHSLFYGGSVQSHIELSKRAQGYGLWCDEWFLGGEALKVNDQDATFWKPILDPIIGAMVAAGSIDTACVGWQLDQLNRSAPGNPLISIIAYVAGALPSSIPLYTHWMNEALAWWKTGGEIWTDKYQTINVEDRFTWWAAMQPYLTGGHHQGDTTLARTNPGLYQDKLCDTLDYFHGRTDKGNMGQSRRSGTPREFILTIGEDVAQDVFNGDCSELEGDGIGYLLMCTAGWNGAHPGGYNNGARLPNGDQL